MDWGWVLCFLLGTYPQGGHDRPCCTKEGTGAGRRAVSCAGSPSGAGAQPLPCAPGARSCASELRGQELGCQGLPGLSPAGSGVPGGQPSASCGKKVRPIELLSPEGTTGSQATMRTASVYPPVKEWV